MTPVSLLHPPTFLSALKYFISSSLQGPYNLKAQKCFLAFFLCEARLDLPGGSRKHLPQTLQFFLAIFFPDSNPSLLSFTIIFFNQPYFMSNNFLGYI